MWFTCESSGSCEKSISNQVNFPLDEVSYWCIGHLEYLIRCLMKGNFKYADNAIEEDVDRVRMMLIDFRMY